MLQEANKWSENSKLFMYLPALQKYNSFFRIHHCIIQYSKKFDNLYVWNHAIKMLSEKKKQRGNLTQVTKHLTEVC